MASKQAAGTATWGCDDVNEGTLHNGCGDARVNGLAEFMQSDAETAACIASLEQSQRDEHGTQKRTREQMTSSSTAAAVPADDDLSLEDIFAKLRWFTLRDANVDAPELRLYNAMLSPDRQLVKAGYFVAEGSLVVQQILRLGSEFQLASILGTETQLRKLGVDLLAADRVYADLPSSAGEKSVGEIGGDVHDARGGTRQSRGAGGLRGHGMDRFGVHGYSSSAACAGSDAAQRSSGRRCKGRGRINEEGGEAG